MAAVGNLPEFVDKLPWQGLAAPPAAKFAAVPVAFQDVAKPTPATPGPNSRPPPRGLKVLVATLATTMVVLLLVGWGLLAVDSWSFGSETSAVASRKAQWRPIIEDPMDDLELPFEAQGLEPADHRCPSCFFQDPGRMRLSPAAAQAFLVYKGDNIRGFEVVAHEFQRPPPLRFWVAADVDADGRPDFWSPVAAEYLKEGCRLGWERGAFRGRLPAPQAFVKVEVQGAPGAGGPQVGQVRLYAAGDADAPQPPATNIATAPAHAGGQTIRPALLVTAPGSGADQSSEAAVWSDDHWATSESAAVDRVPAEGAAQPVNEDGAWSDDPKPTAAVVEALEGPEDDKDKFWGWETSFWLDPQK